MAKPTSIYNDMVKAYNNRHYRTAAELAQKLIANYPNYDPERTAQKILNAIERKTQEGESSLQPTGSESLINQPTSPMLLSTTDDLDGYRTIKHLGIARGSTVRSRHAFSEIGSSFKSVVGGELKGVTKLIADGREQAIARMCRDAEELGANAIKCLRLSTSQVWESATEIIAYGTAVIVEPESSQPDNDKSARDE